MESTDYRIQTNLNAGVLDEVRDWPADPWPKVGVDPIALVGERHSEWNVSTEWELKDGELACKSVRAVPVPKTPFVADEVECDPSIDVLGFVNKAWPDIKLYPAQKTMIMNEWGMDGLSKIRSSPPEEPVTAPIVVEGN